MPPAWDWFVGGGLAVLLAGLAGVRWLAKTVAREEMALVLRDHNGDPFAHQAATKHNHAGINDKLDTLAERLFEVHEDLARLIDAHNAAATTGQCIVVKARREIGEKGAR